MVSGKQVHGTGFGDVIAGDKVAGDKVMGDKYVGAAPRRDQAAVPRPAVILVMTANAAAAPLRLDEERRRIDQALARGHAGGRLEARTADALRLDELQTALLRHRPAVAHFSGHGRAGAGVLLLDEHRQPWPVAPAALGGLLGVMNGSVRCVVLNACFSANQAEQIARHVPCVVGMNAAVADDAAIEFADAFYEAVAFGESVRGAYELGRIRLDMHRHPDAGMPVLLAGAGVAENMVLSPRSAANPGAAG